jgi:hypothetical protein
MAALSRKHTITRKLTFKGLGDEAGNPIGDVDFLVTYLSLPKKELDDVMTGWKLGVTDDVEPAQQAQFDKFVLKVECKAHFDDPALALAYLREGVGERSAVLAQYQSLMYGDLLTKN